MLDVGEVLAIAERFVITGASNTRQVRTIAEDVEEVVKAAGFDGPLRVEGLSDSTWVLLDFGDVVVHVFQDDARSAYDIDALWMDARRVPVPLGEPTA